MMLKITPTPKIVELEEVCSSLPQGRDGIMDHLLKELFPLMDFEAWVAALVREVPEGSATTFGTISRALGCEKASRAVGSLVSRGEGDIPFHRIVYSDGRVPPPSVLLLSGEMDLIEKGEEWFVPEDRIHRRMDLESAPFCSLSRHQESIRGLLERRTGDFFSVAGLDISSGMGKHVCAVCIFDLDGNHEGEMCWQGRVGIPYVSGYLFYREAPLMIPAIMRARDKGLVDDDTLLVIDGNGELHPRRMGLASEMGAVLGMKSCGVAKKLLIGRLGNWYEITKGEYISPVHVEGEILGNASRSGNGSPVYISSGNGTDLDDITPLLVKMKKGGRLPMPVRRAHEAANRCRRSESPSGDL